MRRTLLPTALACSLAACAAVGPDYRAPDTHVPGAFIEAAPARGPLTADVPAFWAAFADPALSGLVAQALAANHDIRIAGASLREARGLRQEVRGGLFPRVDVDATAARDRLSLAQLPGTTIRQRTNTELDAGFDSSWEVDLFGGVRRSVEATSAQAGAADADLGAVRLSIATETARTYFELRGLQRRLAVARDNLGNQSDTLHIVSVRFDAGRGTEFDVSRARGLAEDTRAVIPELEAALARRSHALALLTGQPPGALSGLLQDTPGVISTPPVFALEAPAALLRSRPDVVAAERRVAAATASIGVNTAELFPSVTLFGAVGVDATRGSDLSKANALRYSVGPTLRWNLLDFGRIRSRIEQADARYEGALAAYEQTVLAALRDAEDALVTANRIDEKVQAVAASADASRNAARLAKLRLDAGATDLLDLLDAQRQVLREEDQLSQVETARVVASVALFKAMGGGWHAPGTAIAAASAPAH